MTTGEHLRDVLRREAERDEPPELDLATVVSGALRRRRRTRAVLGGVALSVALVIGVGIATVVLAGGWQRGDRGPVVRPTPSPSIQLPTGPLGEVPYCVPGVEGATTDTLHVLDRTITTWCEYHDFPHPRHHTYLWHHLGTTVVESQRGIHLVGSDGLVRLSSTPFPGIRISSDGRYVVWLEGGSLTGYDVITGHHLDRSMVPSAFYGGWIEGVDLLGRAFVLDTQQRVWMHDLNTREWSEVTGLPGGWTMPGWSGMSYLTPDGFAVLVRTPSASDPVGRSIEGHVRADGSFVDADEVPIGIASWSPDRSRLLQLTADGIEAQRADDLDNRVLLRTPLRDRAPAGLVWDAQWESSETVLVSLLGLLEDESADPASTVRLRCRVETGACEPLPGITLPLSVSAHPGG